MIRTLAKSLWRAFLSGFGWLGLFGGACAGLGMIATVSLAGGGKGATFQERLADAKVLRQYDTEGAEVRKYKVAGDAIALLLWKKDSSVFVVYGLDGSVRFRLGLANVTYGAGAPNTDYPLLHSCDVSEDGRTYIVGESSQGEDESLLRRVFDDTGRLLFEWRSESSLLSSPHGRFFCSLDDLVRYDPLKIFDRAGREIGSFDEIRLGWRCCFLDDEHLLVASDHDTARIIDIPSGRVATLLILGLPGTSHSVPRICLSPQRTMAALYLPEGMVLVSAEGEIVRRETFDEYLNAVIWSDDGQSLALDFSARDRSGGYYELMPLVEGAKVIRSASTPALAKDTRGNCGRFSGDLITRWCTHLWASSQSVVVEWDRRSNALSVPAVLDASYSFLGSRQGASRYVRTRAHGPVEFLSIPNTGGSR